MHTTSSPAEKVSQAEMEILIHTGSTLIYRLKTKADCALEVVAPKCWNCLPFDLSCVDTADTFKKKLGTYLLRLAFVCIYCVLGLDVFLYIIAVVKYFLTYLLLNGSYLTTISLHYNLK